MPKFSDLNTTSLDMSPVIQNDGGDITVKTYLPLQEKLELISDAINNSGDDKGFYNSARVHYNIELGLLTYYTNIEFDEDADMQDVYDKLNASGIAQEIIASIPDSEREFIYQHTYHTIDKIYEYRNSVYGILDALKTDYSDLNLDVDKLTEQLSNKENVEFLKEVIDKMG